jgi:hypothetical protein
MILEPRQAAAGAPLRWSRQAVALIARGFGFWLGLLMVSCLSIFAGHRLPILDGVLALAAFFASVLIAAQLDRPQRTGLGEVLRMLRSHAFGILAFAGVIAVAGALIWMLLLARPGVPWWSVLYTDRNAVDVLSGNWLEAARQVFVYAAYALGLAYFGLNIPGLTSFFQFPCATLLGLSFRDASRLSAAAQVRNLGPMLAVGLMFVTLPVLCVLLFPPLVALLYCFFGALTWVAFREIFLGVPDNRVAEAAPARPAAVRSAAAQSVIISR